MIIGLDIETTGSEPIRDPFKTIQVGIAFGVLDSICVDIGWKAGEFEFQPEARKVNGFTDDRVEQGVPAEMADAGLYYAMLKRGFLRQGEETPGWTFEGGPIHGHAIAVGWNVASFDIQYLKKDLPRFASRLSYHAIDLNAICYGLGGEDHYRFFKDSAKRYAREVLGVDHSHDAGFDAIAALVEYSYLRMVAKGSQSVGAAA